MNKLRPLLRLASVGAQQLGFHTAKPTSASFQQLVGFVTPSASPTGVFHSFNHRHSWKAQHLAGFATTSDSSSEDDDDAELEKELHVDELDAGNLSQDDGEVDLDQLDDDLARMLAENGVDSVEKLHEFMATYDFDNLEEDEEEEQVVASQLAEDDEEVDLGLEEGIPDLEYIPESIEYLPGAQSADPSDTTDWETKIQNASKKQQKHLLQQLLSGRIKFGQDEQVGYADDSSDEEEEQELHMRVVNINRTCKGSRSGGTWRYSAMVVVGNFNGALGYGRGKADDVPKAVEKAYRRAKRNMIYVPRYRGHTIYHSTKAKYGKVIVSMYPRSSGRGLLASNLVSGICQLAGLQDIGVKVHGSRNTMNTVKALFKAFDQMRPIDEVAIEQGKAIRELAVGSTRYRGPLTPVDEMEIPEWLHEAERRAKGEKSAKSEEYDPWEEVDFYVQAADAAVVAEAFHDAGDERLENMIEEMEKKGHLQEPAQ